MDDCGLYILRRAAPPEHSGMLRQKKTFFNQVHLSKRDPSNVWKYETDFILVKKKNKVENIILRVGTLSNIFDHFATVVLRCAMYM